MKIAILSDIHGNNFALEQVLIKAKEEGVSKLLVLGDIVGYYYHPDKILELLSEWSFDMIKGNHENILKALVVKPSLGENIRLKYGSGHKEAIRKLTVQQLDFLVSLPETKTIHYDGVSILMCHGSPWDSNYYIYPDCEKDVIVRCDSEEHDFVLIGHTHYAFAIKNTNSILINPGSVGQSRQIGGNASWAIIDTKTSSFQLMTTPYSIEILLKEVQEKDSKIKYLSAVLKRN
jgi:putative phosphoesterase